MIATLLATAQIFAQPAVAAAIAFLVALTLVPLVRALCIRWRLFDAPGVLKIHTQPIPRLGGVAILVAISAATIVADPRRAFSAWPFFAAMALVWVAGLIDDLHEGSPAFRVAAQLAAGAFLWYGGWRITVFGSSVLGLVAACSSVAALANAMNLLDGMDAIATGVVGIIALAYVTLPGALMSPFARSAAASLAGACAGFLPSNWPRARLFLGDGGSTLFGFTVAFLSLDFCRGHAQASSGLLFPLLVSAVPVLDATFAAIRRLRNRESIFHGDRAHIYDLLAARGWSVRKVIFSLYAGTAAFAAIGCYATRNPSPQAWISAAIGVGLFLCVAIRLGSLRADISSKSARTAESQSLNREFS